LAEAGTTVFVTTHYMDEAEHCQELAFIQRGRIAAQGSPMQIKERVMRGAVIEIDCDRPGDAMAWLRDVQGLDQVSLYGALIHVVTSDAGSHVSLIHHALQAGGIDVRSVEVIPPSLEDAFIASVQAR
jgi:ABC-2 type transport system ATP-binding protein